MALRRELLPILLAAALLLAGPAQALAAPQWLPSRPLVPPGGAPDVTADAGGNSAAAWNSGGHIYVAQRPRGGPWATAEDLTPAGDGGAGQDPRIAALPNGELVVAWVVDGVVQGASKPPGGGWSAPQDLSGSCCVGLEDVVAGTDGTALVYWNSGDGSAQTAEKPPGATSFQGPHDLSLNNEPTKVAVAPDGRAIAAAPADCGTLAAVPCIRAQILPPGGSAWSTPETVSTTAGPATGIGVAARSGAAPFTVAWGESSGAVRSSDRSPGGTWSAPLTVPGTPAARGLPAAPLAGCPSTAFGCVDLASREGGLAVVWQAGTEVAGSVRTGSGAWAARESVGDAPSNDADPAVAIAADGTALAAWMSGAGSTGAVVRGSHRTGGGAWEQQDLGIPSVGEGSLDLGDVAADGDGDARRRRFIDPRRHLARPASTAPGRASARSRSPPAASPGSRCRSRPRPTTTGPALASISWLFGDGTARRRRVGLARLRRGRRLHGDGDGDRRGRQRHRAVGRR